jgi:hypothetical protein
VNPNPSSGGTGPARQGPSQWTDFSEGDRVFASSPIRSTRARTRQAGDLFRPVTSSEPPAAAITTQPVTPLKGLNQDGELRAAPVLRSGYPVRARRWASRGTGLVLGTPGAAIALVASSALVLVVAGMTMSTTSPSTESAAVGPAPGRSTVPATPAISNEDPGTVAPIDAPAASAQQAPATAYSPDSPSAPAHQQASPPANRAVPARLVALPAQDHGPVLPPPSPPAPPPSTVTTEDAGYWTIATGPHAQEPESPMTDTEPCNCDAPKRKIHNYGDRPSAVDRQREAQAQRAAYRSTAQQARMNAERKQGRQPARPDAEARPRPLPH